MQRTNGAIEPPHPQAIANDMNIRAIAQVQQDMRRAADEMLKTISTQQRAIATLQQQVAGLQAQYGALMARVSGGGATS